MVVLCRVVDVACCNRSSSSGTSEPITETSSSSSGAANIVRRAANIVQHETAAPIARSEGAARRAHGVGPQVLHAPRLQQEGPAVVRDELNAVQLSLCAATPRPVALATCNATCNRRPCNLQHLMSRPCAAARVCAGLDCKVSASAQQRIGSIFKIANLEERNVWGELRKARSRQRATRE